MIFYSPDNIAGGLYDRRDLDRLQTDLSFGAQYVRSEHRLDEGVDLMHGSLKFRQELGINGKDHGLLLGQYKLIFWF